MEDIPRINKLRIIGRLINKESQAEICDALEVTPFAVDSVVMELGLKELNEEDFITVGDLEEIEIVDSSVDKFEKLPVKRGRKKSIPSNKWDEACRLALDNIPIIEISRRLQVSRSWLYKEAKRKGFKLGGIA